MTIYTGPVFETAGQQFGIVADFLEIPAEDRARLLYAKRAIAVSVPVHMAEVVPEIRTGG